MKIILILKIVIVNKIKAPPIFLKPSNNRFKNNTLDKILSKTMTNLKLPQNIISHCKIKVPSTLNKSI